MVFVAIDGDNVGASVEKLVILERESELSLFAARIENSLSNLAQILTDIGAIIVFIGGDSLLAKFESGPESSRLISALSAEKTMPFSAGVGGSMREAYIALKIAKTEKGRLVSFDKLDEGEQFIAKDNK